MKEFNDFVDADGKQIIHNDTYTIIESFDSRRMVAGTQAQVVEIRRPDFPFVYCYGVNGGSAYIKMTNLRK